MAYSAALNTVYNHYLTTYAPKSTTQYDTHKKSELRSVYNSIVKLNKEAPLMILDTSADAREFAVGLKESARSFQNTVASLGGLSEEDLLNKKAAYSDNENIASAIYIGNTEGSEDVPVITLEVQSLASSQVNLGKYLAENEMIRLPANAYSFDITINNLSYEFQYNIREDETNRNVQERLARLVTNADIGITADVTADGEGGSALRLTSNMSGITGDKTNQFSVSDAHTSKLNGSVDYLGIDYIARDASNASFLLNGEERTASSNNFTIAKTYEVTLNGLGSEEGQFATIGLKNDAESLSANVRELISGYNAFISTAASYLENHPKSSRLLSELGGIAAHYQTPLGNAGINLQEDGSMELNETAFRDSVQSEDAQTGFETLKNFTQSVLRKTNQISLNPMHYVDKTIVAYKNPGHNFASPYVTSAYSGMMFNSYC